MSCIVWDSFSGQETDNVKLKLEELNIKDVGVPKNMMHLLQPLDLATNGAAKKMEKHEFSNYFNSCIMNAMEEDPNVDVTTIDKCTIF